MTVQWGVDRLCGPCKGSGVSHERKCLKCGGTGILGGAVAVSRRSDPVTSHEAAKSLSPEALSAIKRDVLKALREHGPCTDEELVKRIPWRKEQSVRSRRAELVALGYVVAVGTTKVNSGNRGTVWAAR